MADDFTECFTLLEQAEAERGALKLRCERYEKALQYIANEAYDDVVFQRGYVDEWVEAEMFTACRKAAEDALAPA